jgi:hypothetical protein
VRSSCCCVCDRLHAWEVSSESGVGGLEMRGCSTCEHVLGKGNWEIVHTTGLTWRASTELWESIISRPGARSTSRGPGSDVTS